MDKKVTLDKYEQEIENNLESFQDVPNMAEEIAKIEIAAKKHLKRKKSITIRLSEMDLEAIKIKASKTGIPYQTYIGMIIHKDATCL